MSDFISPEYAKQQEWLHQNTVYGVASAQYAPLVSQIIDKLDIQDLLDYGCGSRNTLLKTMTPKRRVRYQAYDPGVPHYAAEPVPSEMVACIDVLEHIEPDRLDAVMDHLKALTTHVGFFTVSCVPAAKTLPDGRNAHLIQEPPAWWLPKFLKRFDLQTFQVTPEGFYVICFPKDDGPLIITDEADAAGEPYRPHHDRQVIHAPD